MPPDALQQLLDAHEGQQPRIVWYSPAERIELSGHVLSMWQSKAAGLITAESEPGTAVHLGCPTHWRTIAWACGAWLAGRPVVVSDAAPGAAGPDGPDGTDSADGADAVALPEDLPEIGMSVAFEERRLDPEAGIHVLLPAQSLAVRWPGDLPPLVIDGAAELMSHADAFTAVPRPGREPGLILLREAGAGGPITLTRARLAAPPTAAGGGAGPQPAPGAQLVRAAHPGRALLEVLGAWSRGATAVLLAPGADDALAAAAARQEGAAGSPAPRNDEHRS
ncbi:TIGR03089 family protein [Actinomyces bowdenii]|uniref:TIGR03089 family protein n=1 Tax=Actinomyces bowdenii TaxID=131109 RepID=A0A3P1UTK5_9ACTO|nr:TIGR03089 family protein [Actinomyces bowdenii]RRD24445.1 hypothetical protein EII10_11325 [Actinomyces bowdenii]